LTQVSGTTTSYSDSTPSPGITYYYHVTAVNGAGLEGSPSNEASAMTADAPPAAPVGLLATPGDAMVTLDWADNSESDLAGYRAYRATTSGGPYSAIGPSLITTSAFTDTGVVNDVAYYYVVTAVDQGGLVSAPSNEASATPRSAAGGLLSHWELNDGVGTMAADWVGGMHGTLVNGPTWTSGVIGGALSFDGIDDYVATEFRRDVAAWTVSAWVLSPAAPAAAQGGSGPVHREASFQLNWNHPDASYRGAVALRVGGRWYPAGFGPLQANTWYHLAGTYDGETLRAYKDGVLVSSNTGPSGPPDAESSTLTLGRHARSTTAFFAGTVDDVRVYDRPLSASEIASLAAADPGDPPPPPPPPPDPTEPAPPTGLSALGGNGQVMLSWAANTETDLAGTGSTARRPPVDPTAQPARPS
jgi:hypothetical protein